MKELRRLRVLAIAATAVTSLAVLRNAASIPPPVEQEEAAQDAARRESSPHKDGATSLAQRIGRLIDAFVQEGDLDATRAEEAYIWSLRLMNAQVIDLADPSLKQQAVTEHLSRMRRMRRTLTDNAPAGLLQASNYYVRMAEEELTELIERRREADMRRVADGIEIRIGSEKDSTLAYRQPIHLLRSLDATRVSGEADGSLWIWTHEGIPVAAVELFARRNSHNWGHAFISLTGSKLHGTCGNGEYRWAPQSGLAFRRLADSRPVPETSSMQQQRLKELASRFSAHIVDGEDQQEFRLLPDPTLAYSGRDVSAGAVFAFVRGESNPEVLLLIQARENAWEFAIARCSANEVHARLDDEEVWFAPVPEGWRGKPSDPFWLCFVTN